MKLFYKIIFTATLIIAGSFDLSGKYWQEAKNLPAGYEDNYWLDVYFLPSNPNYGWVCGFNGRVIRTTDGGQSWRGSRITSAFHLESIHFPTQNIGYCSGIEGIFKSTNGGETWLDVSPNDDNTYWGCYFVDENYGVVIGEGCVGPQYFFHTTDGGNSWSEFTANIDDTGLTDAIILERDGLGFASSSGYIWRTTDGGQSWEVFSSTGTRRWQEEIAFYNGSFLVPWAGTNCQGGGNAGGIRMSTNYGASWDDYDVGRPMFGTFLINRTTGWACGYSQEVYYTSDGGLNWDVRNCGVPPGKNLDDIWFITPNSGWVVGEGVYKLADDRFTLSKNRMNFGEVCIPESKLDTMYLRIYSFDPATVTLSLYGDTEGAFGIVEPSGSLIIPPCDSIPIVVRFAPVDPGVKTGQLAINIRGTIAFDVALNGYAAEATARPMDTLVTINPAFCGKQNEGEIIWLANKYGERLSSATRVSGNESIVARTLFPKDISLPSIEVRFSANPPDTGWYSARFLVKTEPCSADTFITVNAYGVSPIINADNKRDYFLRCNDEKLDSIDVFNGGNDDLRIEQAYLLNGGRGFEISGWASGKNIPFTIAPGEKDIIYISFKPVTSGVRSETLVIVNNDSTSVRGRKNPLNIGLTGDYSDTDIFPRDTVIDLGTLCLGESAQVIVRLANRGDIDASVVGVELDASLFSVELTDRSGDPTNKISEGSYTDVTIDFTAAQIGEINREVTIKTEPCSRYIPITINANVVESDVSVSPTTVSEVIQTTTTRSRNFILTQNGNAEANITNVRLVPASSEIIISKTQSLPQPIAPGESKTIEIEFLAEEETVIEASLCFTDNGECHSEICIPIKLTSYSGAIEVSLNPVDFGFNKCTAEAQSKIIEIKNTGSIQDTILRLELSPELNEFQLGNLPEIPKYLTAGESFAVTVNYSPSAEGTSETELVIEAANMKGVLLQIPVIGEFRKTEISAEPMSYDFGIAELCEEPRSFEFTLTNSGTLYDTLDINREFNLAGFESPDLIIISPGGTEKLTVTLDISNFSQAGQYVERLILESRVCPLNITLELAAKIIRPLLNYTPKSIDFGNVWSEDLAEEIITVENSQEYERRISSIELVSGSPYFKYSASLPMILQAGQIDLINVQFSSNSSGSYSGMLKIIEESVCSDTIFIPLSANVPVEIYYDTLYITDYYATPGDTITIAVQLSRGSPRINPSRTYFELDFYRYHFYPLELHIVSGGEIVNIPFEYFDGKIIASVAYPYAESYLAAPGDIIYVKGLVLAGFPDTAPLNIAAFEINTTKQVELVIINGTLTLVNYCIEVAEHRVMLVPQPKFYFANLLTAGEDLIMHIEAPDKTNLFISVTNILGSKVYEGFTSIKKGNSVFVIPANELPSGLYSMDLFYGTGAYRGLFIISK